MNTKLLMMLSALGMGVAGVSLMFFPQELSAYWGLVGTPSLLLQLLGALYFSFAMVNWTAKANLIGGIYSRPVSIGNFTHFMIGALTLDKLAFGGWLQPTLVAAGIIYSIFGVLFGYVFFTHPSRTPEPTETRSQI